VRELTPHPATPSAVAAIAAEASRTGAGGLSLLYRVRDPAGALVLPPAAPAVRTDGLWRRTCFEAFVQVAGSEAYWELNLAPGGAWAAYRFDGYRQGMAAAPVPSLAIAAAAAPGGFELSAQIDLSALPQAAAWRVGISAVIEATGQRGLCLSYWALAHPPGDPDFHAAAGFVMDLPAA